MEKHLIKEWFSNVNSGYINDTILVFEDFADKRLADELKRIFKKSESFDLKNVSVESSNYVENTENKNRIIVIKEKETQFNFSNYRILYISTTDTYFYFVKDMESYVQSKDTRVLDLSQKEIYTFYIKRTDPYEFIANRSNEIYDFVMNRDLASKAKLWIDQSSLMTRNYYELLIDDTTYKPNSFHESLRGDIQMLKEDDILTSRLAIVIYRTTQFDVKASATKIGRYFHNTTGVKSKTYNPKHPRIRVIHTELYKRSFKGYDLRINEREMAIRREIAKNLLSLGLKELNLATIAKMTGVDEKEVK